MSILSKHFSVVDGKPIVLRKIDNLILTNTTASQHVSDDQAHMLAALSYYSYSMDPLSQKLADIRISMIKKGVNIDKTCAIFLRDRAYKLGLNNKYTTK